MNATKWTNLIKNSPKDENVRKMVHDELDEGKKFLEAYEAAIDKAAGFLNREFPPVPKSTWAAALNNPDAVHFTDSYREARFVAAQQWIKTQC